MYIRGVVMEKGCVSGCISYAGLGLYSSSAGEKRMPKEQCCGD